MVRQTLNRITFLALTSQAMALPHYRTMPSEVLDDPTTAACTFPDGSSPKGQPGMHCYNVSQFLQAYGIDKLHAQGVTGKGQTIILVDSYGSPTAQADLDHFSDTFGLPRTTIQFIYPNGPYVNPVNDSDHAGWAQETTLDLEWSHAVAPDATIVNIVTNSSETTGLAGFPDLFKGIQMAIAQYPNAILSMSYGTGEPTFTASDIQTYINGQFHQIFQAATNAGMTLLASAGDNGTTNINLAQTSMMGTPNAGYPASDSLVTAVGGTAMEYGWKWAPQGTADDYWKCQLANNTNCPTNFLNSVVDAASTIETVWKEDWALAAGGGGISTIFAAPQYQAKLDQGVQALAKGQRVLPDISMNAAINGGVDVYTSFTAGDGSVTGPTWQQFGGTSCASPETAGMVALAGQVASTALGKNVGIGALNPQLYALNSNAFNDIVSQSFGDHKQVVIDSNAPYFNASVLAAVGPKSMAPNAVPGYQTTAGFDLATGFGSPNAENFVAELANSKVMSEANLQIDLELGSR